LFCVLAKFWAITFFLGQKAATAHDGKEKDEDKKIFFLTVKHHDKGKIMD